MCGSMIYLSISNLDTEPVSKPAQEKMEAAVGALEQQLQELDRRAAAREEEERRLKVRVVRCDFVASCGGDEAQQAAFARTA